MGNRITVNANAQALGNVDRFLDFVRRTSSDFIFLIDPSHALIDETLRHGKKVVVRVFDPSRKYAGNKHFDMAFHREHAPDFVRNHLLQFYSKYRNNRNVYFIVGYNEPNYDHLPTQMRWFVDMTKLAVEAGFNIVVGEWNISKSLRVDGHTGRSEDVERGYWDEVLLMADRYGDRVILGIHVYTLAIPYAQQLDGFPEVLFDPDKLRGLNPRDLTWNHNTVNGQWHVGREKLIFWRAKQLNLKNVHWGISEMPLDNMTDNDYMSSVMERMRANYGMEKWNREIRGIPSLYEFYRRTYGAGTPNYPYQQFCRDVFKGLTWMDRQYRDDLNGAKMLYMAIFAWNFDRFWVTYNVGTDEMAELIELIIRYKSESPKEYVEVETPVELVKGKIINLSPNVARNVRSQPRIPSTGTNVLGTFRGAKAELMLYPTTAIDPHNQYVWLYIKLDSGLAGWIAVEQVRGPKLVDWHTIAELPEPVDDGEDYMVDLVTYTYKVPRSLLDKTAEHYTWLAENPSTPWMKEHFERQAEHVRAAQEKIPKGGT